MDRQGPEHPLQKDEEEETTLPSRQRDLRPRGVPLPSGSRRPPAPEHCARARPAAAIWVSLKACAGVALCCDGGGCCERAVLARLCSHRGCFVASPARIQAWAFGCELWKCAFLFLCGSSSASSTRKRGVFSRSVPSFDSPREGLKEGGGESRGKTSPVERSLLRVPTGRGQL